MALFPQVTANQLIEQRFASGAPSTSSNLVQALSGAIQGARQDKVAKQVGAATTAAIGGTATNEQLGLLFQRDPAAATKILEGAGAVSAQGREKLANTAFRIQQIQNPTQKAAAIQNVAQQIQQSGGDASVWTSMLQGNLQQVDEALNGIRLASLSVKQQEDLAVGEREFGLKEQLAGAQISNLRSQERARSLTAGQKVDQLDFDKQKLEVRKLEAEQTAINNQIKQETNALKRDQLRLQVNEKAQQIEQSKLDTQFTIDSSVAAIDDTIQTTERLLEGEGLEKAAGISSLFFTTPGSEAANFEAVLDTFKSQQFIQEVDKMRGLGALGEKEGQRLVDSAGSLSLSMDDKVLRREITRIQARLRKARLTLQKKFRISPPSSGAVSTDIQSITGDDILNMSTEDLERLLGQ